MNSKYKILLSAGLLATVGSAMLLHQKADAAQPFTFTTIDYPASALPAGAAPVVSTAVWDVNNLGDMVGTYADTKGLYHGFVYRHGRFSTVDGPYDPATGDFAAFTQIRSINDLGDIAGLYIPYSSILAQTPGGGFRGLYQKNGGKLNVYTTEGHLNTIFNKITDTGMVYGCFHDDGQDTGPQDSMFGIVGQIDQWPKVQVITDDVKVMGTPGSTMNVGGNPFATLYTGVFYDHNDGVINGVPGRHRAYIIQQGADGKLQRTNFDVPGSNNTSSWDMNLRGETIGIWGLQQNTDSGYYQGFLRENDGTFQNIQYPGSLDTEPQGINDLGSMVGSYIDSRQKMHGFVARRWFFGATQIGANQKSGVSVIGSVALLMPSVWPALIQGAFGGYPGFAPVDGFSPAQIGVAKVIPNNKPLQAPAQTGMACCHRHAKMAMAMPK